MQNIGKYEITGFLGRGAWSFVYKVRLPVLNKIAALKLLRPNQLLIDLLGIDEIRHRFMREAAIMARLRHPNITEVWDFDEDDGKPFFLMEYYCNNLGIMIGERQNDMKAASRVFGADKAVQYTKDLLYGLSALHGAGLVHRDLKPHNLLLTDYDTVKIIDFGLAIRDGESFRYPKNLIVGSPYYSAPEQCEAPETAGPQADLYSVGVLLFRMLTGILPEEGKKTEICRFNPELDTSWDAFFSKALNPKPYNRFKDAEEMKSYLITLYHEWSDKRDRSCFIELDNGLSRVTGTENRVLRKEGAHISKKEAPALFNIDELWRPRVNIDNHLRDCGDGTILDETTGLVWEREGSSFPMTFKEAEGYVRNLNINCFAGKNQWRLPTVSELLSLIHPPAREGFRCVDPIFGAQRKSLWSSDWLSDRTAWYVNTDLGFVDFRDAQCCYFVRSVS